MSEGSERRLHEKQGQPNSSSSASSDLDLFALIAGKLSAMNLTHANSPDYFIFTYKISWALICICLCLLTITGNLLVLITFRRMRTVGNLFILSLATADLIVGCFVMPIAGIYAIMERWNMGIILCQIWLSVDYTASTASIFNLLTLSLDRYWSITSPLQYLGKRTRARALLLIGFAWGLSLLWVIPIFGWNHFVNNGTSYIDPSKCEPGYTLSKPFKVSTAILNFYLPLLVLICLNGRIYYEIKRRYKNVLLQRHSTKMTESPSNYKLTNARRNSRLPIAMTVCDSDRQRCSTTINYNENDSLLLAKINPDKNSKLRINFKEIKTHRPILALQMTDNRKSSLQPSYSYIEQNPYAQDELPWFGNHQQSRLSVSPHHAGSKNRLNVDERCYKHTRDYHSCRIYSNDALDNTRQRHSFQFYPNQLEPQRRASSSSSSCRRCSFADAMKRSATPTTSTTMNIFNLCHCCSSGITIQSNSDLFHDASRKESSLSISSIGRKQNMISAYSLQRHSIASSVIPRSNSYLSTRSSGKVKQSTVWNQQEKAFRQLFAIVFGFTCCFLPYFILYMVVAFCGSCVSERVVTASIWLGYVNSTINPFLYALSNKHFRRTFHRIIKRDQRRQSYYN